MNKPRQSLITLICALAVLAVLSLCPWSKWTGGRLKDFSLISDLRPVPPPVLATVADNIDPELVAFELSVNSDSLIADTTAAPAPVETAVVEASSSFVAPTSDGVVLFEDYSTGKDGLQRLGNTLAQANRRKVRIAMLGDSYIEGDILAQDIRSGLQQIYGGRGVGYMAAFSQFPGFRGSISQTADNWELHEIRKMGNDPLRTILGTYYTAKEGANTRFRGSVNPPLSDYWNETTAIFIAPAAGHVTLTFGDGNTQIYPVEPSQEPQAISYNEANTKDVRFTSDIPSLKMLGFWLEGSRGIVLDDISLRGNSGVSHRDLNASTTRELRRWIDYDLIILEFGMNALSAAQTDYTAYARGMEEVVATLRRLYPETQILIMGVGDRGSKSGSNVVSMPTVTAMVKAQRNLARRTGVLFWDTRAAMGGEGAAIDWHKRGLINSDYVHLNHRGGKALADKFIESLTKSL